VKEKLQEYALIAEIVGGIAIVASLVFVGIQVRVTAEETALNTRQMQAMVYQELQNQIIESNRLTATDPEFLRLTRKRMAGEQLDAVDRYQYRQWHRSLFRTGNAAYIQFENGIITKDQLDSVLAPMIDNLINNEEFRYNWENSVRVTESFRTYINLVLEK